MQSVLDVQPSWVQGLPSSHGSLPGSTLWPPPHRSPVVHGSPSSHGPGWGRVLQPPEIRHRVLEASVGLEVIELGCPAIHETQADHALLLPNLQISPLREFDGQRFMRHVAADARWIPWTWMGHDTSGFEMRNSGISAATNAIAHVQVVRAGITGGVTPVASYDGELLSLLSWMVQLHSAALGEHTMQANDCATIPAGTDVSLSTTAQTEFLYVAFPGS